MNLVQQPDLVVVGSANADLIIPVPRRPLAGETILGGDTKTVGGGKGANQAAAAAISCSTTSFIGAFGGDDSAQLLKDSLHLFGVDTSRTITVAAPTGIAIIYLTPDGENSIVVSPGANNHLTPLSLADVQPIWRSAKVVVFSLEIPLETVTYVGADAAAHGARVIINAAPAASLSKNILELCDPLIVNEHEARIVLRISNDVDQPGAEESFEQLATKLVVAGAKSVIITLGAEGVIYADKESSNSYPAFVVTPVDTTGSGDAFVGAFASAVVAGKTTAAAIAHAQATAALATLKLGAQTSYPSKNEVESFLAEFANGLD